MYDINYYENMLRMYSSTAKQISTIRWEFISELHPHTVLDYGSGVGWFRAFRPKDVIVDSYDIAEYPQTKVLRNEYDVVCLWDVLEHIPRFSDIRSVLNSSRFVALTLPLLEEGINVRMWKHFKPDEHLHFFTKDVLAALFDYYCFDLIKEGQPECPPREDIWSFVFKRRV